MSTKKEKAPWETGEGKQITVEFLRDVQYENEGRRQGPKFYRGRTYTFDAWFAERWIKRGAAYDVAGDAPEPEAAEKLPPETGLTRGGASMFQ